MEKHRIKRLPVMRGPKLVGIVSRANLLQTLACLAGEAAPAAPDDETIRRQLLSELDKQDWAPHSRLNILVRNTIFELWGTITDERQRQALIVAAENIPGVKGVRDHLAWIELYSGVLVETLDE